MPTGQSGKFCNVERLGEWQKVRGLPVQGDLIWIRQQRWRVQATHTGAGLTRVVVDDGRATRPRTFLLPVEPWTSDQPGRTRGVSRQRALAWLAACSARACAASTPTSIVHARTTLFAYQLEPALAVLAGARRVLIADGVGLGKTVQAALIVAETLRREADARVLVLVPPPLMAQWADELETRFGVPVFAADAASFARLRADRPYLVNPWESAGVWLVSPDYLKQPHILETLPRRGFDAVVIDEAHAMAGDSQRRWAIDTIARSARRVILLTATPHDGDDTRFRRLIDLGATGAKADALVIFRRAGARPSRRTRRVDVNAGPGLSQVLDAIDAFERTAQPSSPCEGLRLICGVFRKRALSSLAAFHASLERRLALVTSAEAGAAGSDWVQLEFFGTDLVPGDEWAVLAGDAGLSAAQERTWLLRLQGVSARAMASGRGDPKLTRLRDLLRRSDEPAVVFTEYRDTLQAVAIALTDLRHLVVLHGGLSGTAQRHALREFLEGRANTLLATDVASQGLNLQHRARWVVNVDVPWTPMRLEQRVGRVDRIGQSRSVHVTMLGVRHEADNALRARVAARQHLCAAAPLPTCTRWTRAAVSLARWFTRQRALAAQWRGPDPAAVPRAVVPLALMRRVIAAPGAAPLAPAITIVEIPLVSGAGDVVERHLGLAAGADGPNPALVRRARALSARARRRRRRLAAALAADVPASPEQPGLFDARAVTAAAPGDSAASCGPDEDDVRVGPARALLVLEARR